MSDCRIFPDKVKSLVLQVTQCLDSCHPTCADCLEIKDRCTQAMTDMKSETFFMTPLAIPWIHENHITS